MQSSKIGAGGDGIDTSGNGGVEASGAGGDGGVESSGAGGDGGNGGVVTSGAGAGRGGGSEEQVNIHITEAESDIQDSGRSDDQANSNDQITLERLYVIYLLLYIYM